MIESGAVHSFDFLSVRRDFRTLKLREQFSLEILLAESDWALLADFPRDAIGAIRLVFPEVGRQINMGFSGCLRKHVNREESNEIFLLHLRVEGPEWWALGDPSQLGSGEAGICWQTRAVKPEKVTKSRAVKLAKGRYGQVWRSMMSFHNRLDVREWLGVEVGYAFEAEAIAKIYERFNVTSRSFISPEALLHVLGEAHIKGKVNLAGAITFVEGIRAKVGTPGVEVR